MLDWVLCVQIENKIVHHMFSSTSGAEKQKHDDKT
jgi:hypothetical protein